MTFRVKKICKECNGSGKVHVVNPALLRQQRLKSGMSLRAFATKVADMSPPYISDVERGIRKCTPKLEKLYGALK